MPPKRGLAPVRDVRGHGPRRADARSTSSARTRCSPRPTHNRTRAAARGPRVPRRAGHLPDRRRPSSPTSCFPASASVVRVRGHRHQQRATRAARAHARSTPPGEARDDLDIVVDLARAMGIDWGHPTAEDVWNELRSLSPDARRHELRAARGRGRAAVAVLRRAAPGRALPARPALGGAGRRPAGALQPGRARPAGRQARRRVPDPPDHRPPPRLATTPASSRAATARRSAAARRSSWRPRTCARYGVARRRARARRARAAAPSRCRCASTTGLRPGLAFMTLHFPDEVATNVLTIDATDPALGHGRVQGHGHPHRAPGRPRRLRRL